MKDAFSAETLALIEEKIPDNLGSDWLSDLWLSFSPTFELNLDPLTREEIGTPKEATVAVWSSLQRQCFSKKSLLGRKYGIDAIVFLARRWPRFR